MPGRARPTNRTGERRRLVEMMVGTLAMTLVILSSFAHTAAAQPEPLPCLDCSFTVDEFISETYGKPGDLLRTTIVIANTGQGEDTYGLAVSSSDPAWFVDINPRKTPEVAPAGGPLPADRSNTTANVTIVVPLDARANDGTTVTVTVTSERIEGDESVKTLTIRPTTEAVLDWRLDCHGPVTVQKAHDAQLRFTIRNTGNLRSAVLVTANATDGFVLGADQTHEIEPQDKTEGNMTIGAGLRVQDGIHTATLTVAEINGGNAYDMCDIDIEVVPALDGVGRPGNGGDGDGTEDSPGIQTVAVVAALMGLVAHRRRDKARCSRMSP